MQATNHSEKKYTPPVRSKKLIGNTTFIVNSFYQEQAKESVTDKLERLIKADLQKENATFLSEPG